MASPHYYMVIEDGLSEIVEANTPREAPAAVAQRKYYQGGWHLREGRAVLHWIGYEFHPSGRSTGRKVDVVDLGAVTAYDRPGLPRWRGSKEARTT